MAITGGGRVRQARGAIAPPPELCGGSPPRRRATSYTMPATQLRRLLAAYLSHQFGRFVLFGGAAAAVNLAVGYAIYGTRAASAVPYWLAVVIASASGLLVNFALNYIYNFEFRGRSALGQFRTFFIVAVIGTFITGGLAQAGFVLLRNLGILAIPLLGQHAVSAAFAAHIVAVGLTMFYSFAAHRYFSFNVGLRARAGEWLGKSRNKI